MNETFGQIDNENPAFVHDLTDVEGRFWLTDDVADDGIGGKGADLVEDWRHGLGNELVVPAGEFDVPELQDYGVTAIAQRFFAEVFIS